MRIVRLVFCVLLSILCMSGLVLSQDDVDLILERVSEASDGRSSDAVILLDSTHVTIDEDGAYEAVVHMQTLLLSWEAIDAYGQVSLPYREGDESLELLYARTILPDGNVVVLDEARISRSSIVEGWGADAFSELQQINFHFPALRPGVVIDYAFSFVQQTPLIEGAFSDDWYFDAWDPVLESEYILNVPKEMDFTWKAKGIQLEPSIQSTSERIEVTIRTSDIPGIHYESQMPSLLAVGASVSFSSVESWEDVSRWWWNLASHTWHVSDAIRELALELTNDAMTRDEKVAALYDYVSRNVRYVSLGLGTSGFEPRSADETLATQYGDCKDQTALLLALLASVGIEAFPGLLNTAAGYQLDWLAPPSPRAFDHVIVAVSDETGAYRFLDPTCDLCTARSIDSFIAAHKVLLAMENPTLETVQVAVPTPMAAESYVRSTLRGTLQEDGVLRLETEAITSGDHDIGIRSLFLYYRPTDRRNLLASIVDYSLPQAVLLDYAHSDLDDLYSPVSYSVYYEREDAVRWLSNGMGLLPLPVGASLPLPSDYSEAVAVLERVHPLVTLAERIEWFGGIDVGAHDVVELPEAIRVENEVGVFSSQYRLEGSEIVYERILQLDVPDISADQYPFYRALVRAMLEDSEASAVLQRL